MFETLLIPSTPPAPSLKTVSLLHFDQLGTGNYVDEAGNSVSIPANVYPMVGDAAVGPACANLPVRTTDTRLPTVNLEYTIGKGDYTVEAWAKGWSIRQYIRPVAYSNSGVYFAVDDSGRTLYYVMGTQIYLTNGAISSWEHHAIVRSNNITTIFRNGAIIYRSNGAAAGDTTDVKFTPFNLISGWADALPQYLDEVRFSKVARYTSAFTPQTTPFELD